MAQNNLTFKYSVLGNGVNHLIVEIYNVIDYSVLIDSVIHPPVTVAPFAAQYIYNSLQEDGTYAIFLYDSVNGITKGTLLNNYYKSNKPPLGREIMYTVGGIGSAAKAIEGENVINDPLLQGVNILFVAIEGRGIISKNLYNHDSLTGQLSILNRGALFEKDEVISVFIY